MRLNKIDTPKGGVEFDVQGFDIGADGIALSLCPVDPRERK